MIFTVNIKYNMIYIFFTVTIRPTNRLWGPNSKNDIHSRILRYERCIHNSLEHLKETDIKPVILINDKNITSSSLDKFKEMYSNVDVLYTNNNIENTDHKGLCELEAVLYGIDYYKLKDEDIVIKQTGRYLTCDTNSNYFYQEVINNQNTFDCFGKFYDIATDKFISNTLVLGLFAMRVKYLKKFQYRVVSVSSAEIEFGEYAKNYIPENRIQELTTLHIEYCPANEPDKLGYA